jgi:hypothetical protein
MWRDVGTGVKTLEHASEAAPRADDCFFIRSIDRLTSCRFSSFTGSALALLLSCAASPIFIDLPTLFQAAILSNTTAMMDQDPEQKTHHAQEIEHDAVYSEKTAAAENKAGAIEAENIEHNMTVLEAVKAYPMASFWAFVMSCTIVSPLSISRFEGCND